MVVEIKKFLGIIIQLFILVVLYMTGEELIIFEWYTVFIPISLIVINRFITGKWITLYNIFVIIISVFHFGVFWLYLMNIPIDVSNGYDLASRYPESIIICALRFSLISLCILNIFADIKMKNVRASNVGVPGQIEYRISKIIYFSLAPFILFNDINRIILTRAFSYSSAVYMSSFIGRFEICFLIASLFLIASKNKLGSWVFVYMLIRCFVLMVLSGSRIGMLLELILILFLKISLEKISAKKTIGIFILGCFSIVLIGYVKLTRGNFSISLSTYLSNGGVLTSVLSELGSTMITLLLAISHDTVEGGLQGLSYLSSMLTLIPFSTRLFPFITEYRVVHDLLNQYAPAVGTLGGSFFAEQFMNFGMLGCWLSVPFGWVFGAAQNKVYEDNSTFSNIIFVAFFYGVLIYSRANLYDFISNINGIIYFLMVYYILKRLIMRNSK